MSQRLRLFASSLAILALSVSGTLLLLTLLYRQLSGTALHHFDLLAQMRIHAMTTPLLTDAMLALTWIGAIKIFAGALACAVLWLAARGRGDEAWLLGGGMAGAFLLNETLKLHFHRPRPQVPWSIGDEHTFSFPSGHSLFAVVLYGTLAYLALRRAGRHGQRLGIVLPAVLMPPSIGLSRIYLGMHYPTDVLAGWLAGAMWLAAIVLIHHICTLRRGPGATTQVATNSHAPSRFT